MPRLASLRWPVLVALLTSGVLACDPKARPGPCSEDADCPEGQGCVAGLCVLVDCREDADCEAGESCVDHTCLSGGECSLDGECALGQVCEQGRCVAGCRTDRDCPADARCLGAEDGLGECAECLTDADCAAGERCLEGACRQACQGAQDCPGQHCDPGTQTCVDCLEDGHCAVGEICTGGECVAGCRSDRDCPAGQSCQQGVCVSACAADADCPLDQYCAAGTCTPGCRDDAGCAAGEICQGHACVQGCRDDADCPAGQVCDGSACRQGCRDDADCPAGQVCDPGALTCVECRASSDCALGELCVQGACVPGCETQRDCPAGQTCDPALGEHGLCVECRSDADCTADPEAPRCLDYRCTYECTPEEGCSPPEVCVAHHCQTPVVDCDLILTPSAPVAFGEVGLGATRALEVNLENAGLAACTVSALEVRTTQFFPGDFLLSPLPPLPLVLAPAGQDGSRARMDLVFAPASQGSHMASLRLTSDDPDLQVGADQMACTLGGGVLPGQACVPLSGQGVFMQVQAVPLAVDFGDVQTGCDAGSEEVAVYNLGAEVQVTALTLDDPGQAFLIEQAPALPLALARDASFRVRLGFRPPRLGPALGALGVELSAGLALEVPLRGAGVAGASVSDSHALPADMQVDVLWVVDNSGSMAPVQESMAENIGSFLSLADSLGVDYHLGVVSTEVNEAEQGLGDPPREVIPGVLVHAPARPRFVTPSTPERLAAFQDNVRIGSCCSDEQEAGLQASFLALSPPRVLDPLLNGGFLREHAKLYAVYVSSEEDQSAGPAGFYLDFLRSLKPSPELVRLSAVCGDAPAGCESLDGSLYADSGDRYLEVQAATGGIFQSICSQDWSGLMGALGQHMVDPIRAFPLSRQPVVHTLAVRIDGASVPEASTAYAPDGWTYEPGVELIWFGDQVLPPLGSTVRIDYQALCL